MVESIDAMTANVPELPWSMVKTISQRITAEIPEVTHVSLSVSDKDSVILTTTKGMTIRIRMKELRVMGRATQGVHVVKLKEGDRVADAVKVPSEDELPEVSGPQTTL